MAILTGVLGYLLGFLVCAIIYNNQSRATLKGIYDILNRMTVTADKKEL